MSIKIYNHAIENDLREIITSNIFLDKTGSVTLISVEDMKHINKLKVKELIETVIKEFELTHPCLKLAYFCSDELTLTISKSTLNLNSASNLCAIDYNMRRFKRAANVVEKQANFVSAFMETY
jgi:hypothetical protein